MTGIVGHTGAVSGLSGSTVSDPAGSTGSVLQALSVHSITQTSIVNGDAVVLTKTFNRTKGNSHFICQAVLCIGMYTNNSGQDAADPQAWWYINSSNLVTNAALAGNDGFWYSDVPKFYGAGSHQDRYDVNYYHCTQDLTHISSGSANDSVVIAVKVAAASYGLWMNRCQNSTDSGGVSSLQILEIAA